MSVHLFLGDPWLRRRAVERLKRQLHSESGPPWREILLDGEDFPMERFVEALQTSTLFQERALVHVRRIEKLARPEALIPYLQGLPPERVVILEGEKLDKRTVLYKHIAREGRVHDHPRPDRRNLPTLVQEILKERGVRLPPQGLKYLLESVEEDLGRLAREIDKLALFAPDGNISLEDLQGMLFHDKGGNVFTALDALLERRRAAPAQLQALLGGGEEPSKVFYLLAAQVRALIAVRSLADEGLSNEEIAKRTRDFPWRTAKRRKLAAKTPLKELIGLLHRLHEEDVRMKRGERTPEGALWALALEWLFSGS
jgi:DNA polymerase-3 subunit delta